MPSRYCTLSSQAEIGQFSARILYICTVATLTDNMCKYCTTISDEIDKSPFYSLLLTLESFDVNRAAQDTSTSLILGTSPSSSMSTSVLVAVSMPTYEKTTMIMILYIYRCQRTLSSGLLCLVLCCCSAVRACASTSSGHATARAGGTGGVG